MFHTSRSNKVIYLTAIKQKAQYLSCTFTIFIILQYIKMTVIEVIGLGAFAASELDKVFSGYQPR